MNWYAAGLTVALAVAVVALAVGIWQFLDHIERRFSGRTAMFFAIAGIVSFTAITVGLLTAEASGL